MELVPPDEKIVEFAYKDVTFLARTRRSAGDRYTINTNGVLERNGTVKFNLWEYYKAIIQTFVVGWKNVTENGKDVPYSFDTFMSRFPDVGGEEDVVLKLGVFVAGAVGLLKEGAAESDARKNG